LNNRVRHLLVTGASGFVVRILCATLLGQKYVVRSVIRNSSSSNRESSEVFKVTNINADTKWNGVMTGVDVVIHLAARVHVMHDNSSNPLDEFRKVNVAGTEHLARSAAACGVKRLVYGAGVKGNFAQMLKMLAKGVPLPLASVNNRRSLVYVENLVDALILCATHPAAKGQTYLVSDGKDISTSDLLRQLGVAMGKPARLFPFPQFLLKLAGRLVGKSDQVDRLLGSLRVDSGKIHRELDWQPPYAVQEGLRITGQSVLNFKNELEW